MTLESYKLILSARALSQLQELHDYIAVNGSPLAAQRHAARLLAAIETLQQFPNRGRLVGANVRELTTVPPHVIRYRVVEREVEIIRIRHGARRPG